MQDEVRLVDKENRARDAVGDTPDGIRRPPGGRREDGQEDEGIVRVRVCGIVERRLGDGKDATAAVRLQ